MRRTTRAIRALTVWHYLFETALATENDMRPDFYLAAALVAAVACNDSSPTESDRSVATVTISPVDGTVWTGTTRQLVATARAADGTALPGRPITWTGDNDGVAVIDASGRLEARTAGSILVAAMSQGKRAELRVTVSEAELAYEGYPTGLPELFVLSLRGGEPTRVLPPYTLVTDPTLSPDGSKIAFVVADYESATGDIFVVNRDGTGLTQLTFDSEMDDQPAWSPDGTKIAFRSFRTQGQGDIWVMNADGTDLVNLTPDPLPGITDEARPAWSPDGTHRVREHGGWEHGPLDHACRRRRQATAHGDHGVRHRADVVA